MHPVNRFLVFMGIGVHRVYAPPRKFVQQFETNLKLIQSTSTPFTLINDMACDIGVHPTGYQEYECGFAASCLASHPPLSILDIGSYRQFVLGLSAAYNVRSLDVRKGPKLSDNEEVIIGDAKALNFSDNQFDAIISLSSIEHFGLGRYGDEFDLNADSKAVNEMKRCLKPGGYLIFSTTLTAGDPQLVYNCHRIYTLPMLQSLCAPLICEREAFHSRRLNRNCDLASISTEPGVWDVYCGCWRKRLP
jgi:SAM-dependent methyltransferase